MCPACGMRQKNKGNFSCEICHHMMRPCTDDSVCLLCEMPNKGEVLYKIRSCGTLLHLECYMEHIATALKDPVNMVPILCPNPECEKAADGGQNHYLNCEADSLARTNAGKLSKDLREKLAECQPKWLKLTMKDVSDIQSCPTPNCTFKYDAT